MWLWVTQLLVLSLVKHPLVVGQSRVHSHSSLVLLVLCREKDPDPEGKQLAATKDPLGEATKLVQQLKQYAGDRIKTHLLAFEVGFLLCKHVLCVCPTPGCKSTERKLVHCLCNITQRSWSTVSTEFGALIQAVSPHHDCIDSLLAFHISCLKSHRGKTEDRATPSSSSMWRNVAKVTERGQCSAVHRSCVGPPS